MRKELAHTSGGWVGEEDGSLNQPGSVKDEHIQ